MDVPEAIAAWAALFPADLGPARGICRGGAFFDPSLGLVAHVGLYDITSYEGPHADLLLAPAGELEAVAAAIEQVRLRLAALAADEAAALAALEQPVEATLALPAIQWPQTYAPSTDDIARREAAIARAYDRFPGVADRVRGVYGMRLPQHVAVWDAFVRSLSPLERHGLDYLGFAPAGPIMTWFEDDGLDRPTRDNLDPRLDYRFRCDPPELVTIMVGTSDGLHFGLWYDDPHELPSCIAHNHAHESAETTAGEATLLRELLARARRLLVEPEHLDEPPPLALHAIAEVLAWFEEVDDEAYYAEDTPRYADLERGHLLGGMPSALPDDDRGDPRTSREVMEQRAYAYRADALEAEVIIEQARIELAVGSPAYALTVGRELHWLDADEYRAASLELLTEAYEQLGRHALADLVRVHHAYRDLEMVAIY